MTSTRAARLVSISVCATLALMLAGCQTLTLSGGIDARAIGRAPFCSTAEPITYSHKDTPETQKQIREHNAVGVALCGWGSAK